MQQRQKGKRQSPYPRTREIHLAEDISEKGNLREIGDGTSNELRAVRPLGHI